MKAIISDIKRFAVHDGDGIRTTVFFKGCPLRCRWCHNPEGIDHRPQLSYIAKKCIGCGACAAICSNGAHEIFPEGHGFHRERCVNCGACVAGCMGQALKLYGREISLEQLMPRLLEDRAFYESSGGGVTLSGGEPLVQANFCRELLKRLKEEGIHTAVDTCGCVDQRAIEAVLPYTDQFLYDVKAVDEAVHIHCTGVSNRRILENLAYIDGCGTAIEIRIPYVPGMNDGEIEGIGAFLKTLKMVSRVKVLPYHSFAGSKYEALGIENTMPPTEPPDDEALSRAVACLKSFGLNAVSGRE